MKKYVKKPIVIEAVQWNGNNKDECIEFSKGKVVYANENNLFVCTLEGTMAANKGDYIIKGIRNEFYPIKEDIFKETYESID